MAGILLDSAAMNVPNKLTVLRLALSLLYLGLMSSQSLAAQAGALLVFIIASITDFLDGNIARKYNLVTSFGKLMDPLADKILMLAAFVMMMPLPGLWIPGWAVVLILAREFLVTGLRTLAAAEGAVLAALNSGKTKTVMQITFVIAFSLVSLVLSAANQALIPASLLPLPLPTLTLGAQWASFLAFLLITVYTVHSGIEFTRANWRALRLNEL